MIPIFRAFSEIFDKYILGVPYFSDGKYYMLVDDCNKNDNVGTGSFPIEPATLAIHFPDMLDSQGNKIFASLSEDGKGGDILKTRGNEAPCKFNKGFTIETIMGISNLYMLLDKVKVIGIQK